MQEEKAIKAKSWPEVRQLAFKLCVDMGYDFHTSEDIASEVAMACFYLERETVNTSYVKKAVRISAKRYLVWLNRFKLETELLPDGDDDGSWESPLESVDVGKEYLSAIDERSCTPLEHMSDYHISPEQLAIQYVSMSETLSDKSEADIMVAKSLQLADEAEEQLRKKRKLVESVGVHADKLADAISVIDKTPVEEVAEMSQADLARKMGMSKQLFNYYKQKQIRAKRLAAQKGT